MAALEAGKLESNEVRMPRHILRGPNLAAGVLAVRVLPDISDGERVRTLARQHVLAEQAPQNVVVDRQAVLREYRVSELLELFQNLVIHTGVVVIRAAQQDHAQAVFPFQLFQHLAGGAAHGHVVEVGESAIALLDGALVLLRREAEDIFELLEHLPLEKVGLGEVDEGVQKTNALFREQVAFFRERGLYRCRRCRHGGARAR